MPTCLLLHAAASSLLNQRQNTTLPPRAQNSQPWVRLSLSRRQTSASAHLSPSLFPASPIRPGRPCLSPAALIHWHQFARRLGAGGIDNRIHPHQPYARSSASPRLSPSLYPSTTDSLLLPFFLKSSVPSVSISNLFVSPAADDSYRPVSHDLSSPAAGCRPVVRPDPLYQNPTAWYAGSLRLVVRVLSVRSRESSLTTSDRARAPVRFPHYSRMAPLP